MHKINQRKKSLSYFVRRVVFFLVGLCFVFVFDASAQQLQGESHDFGKVKMWNNPSHFVKITNNLSKDIIFLPTTYQRDIAVHFGQNRIEPGETTTIELKYYSEDFGRFSKPIDVYISSQSEPLRLSLSGSISSFHPDAFTYCPSIENTPRQNKSTFIHTIRVIDSETRMPVTDFNLSLITQTSQEKIVSEKSSVTIRREKPSLYNLEVEKEGYKLAREKVYIQKFRKETVVQLVPEPQKDTEHTENTDEKIMIDTPIQEETVVNNLPPIVEDKDVVVSTMPVDPTLSKETVPVLEKDTQDFDPTGKLNDEKYAYNHIVFLIDVSSSMKNEDKLPLLQKSMLKMIEVLRPQDQVSIITYASGAEVVAENIGGENKEALVSAISGLVARGQSFGQEGVNMAYKIAKENFVDNGNNEVILASDGIFNSRNFKQGKMFRQVTIQRRLYDVRLSTIGFGKTKKALEFMSSLASYGDGSYLQIQSIDEAEEALVTNLMRHSLKD